LTVLIVRGKILVLGRCCFLTVLVAAEPWHEGPGSRLPVDIPVFVATCKWCLVG
jgi:hypothetical protein